jgi:CHAT domain-containing protein
LWKVDDLATQELMVFFYKNWLGGASKQDSFARAQAALRAKYPHPFYWGAFVMLGE